MYFFIRYTPEQQSRLGVDEMGNKAVEAADPSAGPSTVHLEHGNDCAEVSMAARYVRILDKLPIKVMHGPCNTDGYTEPIGAKTFEIPMVGEVAAALFRKGKDNGEEKIPTFEDVPELVGFGPQISMEEDGPVDGVVEKGMDQDSADQATMEQSTENIDEEQEKEVLAAQADKEAAEMKAELQALEEKEAAEETKLEMDTDRYTRDWEQQQKRDAQNQVAHREHSDHGVNVGGVERFVHSGFELPFFSPYVVIAGAICGFAIGLSCTIVCCRRISRSRRVRMQTTPLEEMPPAYGGMLPPYSLHPPPGYKLHDDNEPKVAVVVGSFAA